LRQLTRYRRNIVADVSTQKNRIEKSLQTACFKLSSFLSDIFGVSGRKLIELLINKGCLTAKDVEIEAKYISAEKRADIKRCINKPMDKHNREFLKMQLAHLDELLEHLKSIEQSITEMSDRFKEAIERLDTIPGIAETAATAIVAEVGTDMSKFPSAEHFCSWAGLSPGNNESAGKKKSSRILYGNPYIKGLICECAWSIICMRDNPLSNFYWKIKQRRGGKKAIIALSRKLFVIIYNLLKNGTAYDEQKHEIIRQKQEILRFKRISTEAKKLGFDLKPIEKIA
jgi:transposase